MGKMSRDKGKRGEREFWKLCEEHLGDKWLEDRRHRIWMQHEEERWDMTIGPFAFEVKRLQRGDDWRLAGYWREAVSQVDGVARLIPALAYRFDQKGWMVQLRILDVMVIVDHLILDHQTRQVPEWGSSVEYTVTMPFEAFVFLCREYISEWTSLGPC